MSWWHGLIAINIFFVLMTVMAAYVPRSEPIGFLFRAFSLGFEMNIGAWWSGVYLLSAALLAYELYGNSLEKNRVPWLILAIIFAGLSLDEIGSIHERVGGWSIIIPVGLAGVLFLGYALVLLYRNPDTRRTCLMLFAALVLFGIVAIQEWIEDEVQWPFWMTGIRVGVEEGTEIAAVTLILVALFQQRQDSLHALAVFPPNPFRFHYFSVVVFSGLILHVCLSFLTEYYFQTGPAGHGSPAVWYPSALFFILALSYFSTGTSTELGGKKWLFFLSAFFLVASISCMYVISPRAETSIISPLAQSIFFYVCALGLIMLPALLGILSGTLQLKALPLIALVVALFITFALEVTLRSYIPRYILIGMISYSLSLLYSVERWKM
jgi:hypothetical protein